MTPDSSKVPTSTRGIRREQRDVEIETHGERGGELVVRPALADALDDRGQHVPRERTVRAGDVVHLEVRRGREHDVGEARGVGHHLLVHDCEDVVTREPVEHELLIRDGSPPGWHR